MSKEKLHIYLRVSTDPQAEEGFGLENQRDLSKAVCSSKGWTPIFYDEGAESSSNEDINSRPELVRLLGEVDRGVVKHLWVYEIDRLSRNDTTKFLIRKKLKDQGVTVWVGAGSVFDLTDHRDRLLYGIMSEIAEFDQAQRTERLRRGRLSKVKIGGWKGGPPPYGYKIVDGFLVEDTQKSKWVRKIYQWYRDGESQQSICSKLLSNGVETPRGGIIWNANSVLKILNNTHYDGYHYYTDKILDETVRVENPRLLDSSLVAEVKEALSKRRVKKANNQKIETMLKGLLFCGHCGTQYGQRVLKHRYRRHYYCRGNESRKRFVESQHKKRCIPENGVRVKGLKIDQTDEFVWSLVIDTLSESHIFKEQFKKEMMEGVTYSQSVKDSSGMEKLIKKNEKSLKDLKDARNTLIVNSAVDKRDIKDLLKKFDDKESGLKLEISNLKTSIKEMTKARKWVDWVGAFSEKIEDFKNADMTIEQKKDFLQGVLDRINVKTIDNQTHQFELKFKLPYVEDDLSFEVINGRKRNYTPIDGKDCLVLNFNSENGDYHSIPTNNPSDTKKN